MIIPSSTWRTCGNCSIEVHYGALSIWKLACCWTNDRRCRGLEPVSEVALIAGAHCGQPCTQEYYQKSYQIILFDIGVASNIPVFPGFSWSFLDGKCCIGTIGPGSTWYQPAVYEFNRLFSSAYWGKDNRYVHMHVPYEYFVDFQSHAMGHA
jgi:hypothetical protein